MGIKKREGMNRIEISLREFSAEMRNKSGKVKVNRIIESIVNGGESQKNTGRMDFQKDRSHESLAFSQESQVVVQVLKFSQFVGIRAETVNKEFQYFEPSVRPAAINGLFFGFGRSARL